MAGTIMPIGFKINPWSVFCLICNGEAAKSLGLRGKAPREQHWRYGLAFQDVDSKVNRAWYERLPD
jgi:hypothetical protein